MISRGKLIKLKFMYDEQIDETCVSQTNAYNTSASAKVWLKKMAADNKPLKLEGSTTAIAMLSQTVLEGTYSGQFVFGGYNEIYVSCIYTSTTKPATNQLQRLAFLTPQSVMCYVENLANDTNNKNFTFLTLIRMEKQTRITLDVTSTTQNSSIARGKDNELLFYSDGWIFVSIVIWIAFVLYSPAVFLLCYPSDVAVRKTGEERRDGSLPSPVQEGFSRVEEEHDEVILRDGNNINADNNGNHAEENDEVVEDEEDEKFTNTPISVEAQTNETGHSEMVAPSLGILRSNRKTEDRERIAHDGKILGSYDKQSAATNDNEKIPSTSTCSEPKASTSNTGTASTNNNEEIVDKTEPSTTNDNDVIASTSACSEPLDCDQETRSSDASAIATELSPDDAATPASNRNAVEKMSGSDGNRNSVSLDIEPVNHHITHTDMIIVGGPCPTAIGS